MATEAAVRRGTPWEQVFAHARGVFGITELRPGQRELTEAALGGRDALGILPTGGGKSLCFQLASLFLPKTVVVVTPLVSLAEDQTDKLELRRVAAVRLDSTLRAHESQAALAELAGGKLDLLYVTPERLQNPEFMAHLQAVGCSLLVVDEAHCVSQWGHDFRPAYLELGAAAAALGRPPILALTATATPAVEQDIARQLGLRDPLVVRTSSERKNLSLAVMPALNAESKQRALTRLLAEEPGAGLIYTSTVRSAKEVFARLLEAELPVGLYHGQLHPVVRDATQDAFMDGRYRIVIATKAFGMGIDKPNTRFVIHHDLPDSMESYAQEAGRGGRDGKPARAILLFDRADERVQRYFLRNKYPTARAVSAFANWIGEQQPGHPLDPAALDSLVRNRHRFVLLAHSAELGLLQRTPKGFESLGAIERRTIEARLNAHYDVLRLQDDRRLQSMIDYSESAACRTNELLRYFEEERAARCERCDNCGAARGRVVRRRHARRCVP